MTKKRKAAANDRLGAACAFRETLIGRADKLEHGEYPLWYGWAIIEAFQAGAKYARDEPKKGKGQKQ